VATDGLYLGTSAEGETNAWGSILKRFGLGGRRGGQRVLSSPGGECRAKPDPPRHIADPFFLTTSMVVGRLVSPCLPNSARHDPTRSLDHLRSLVDRTTFSILDPATFDVKRAQNLIPEMDPMQPRFQEASGHR
jgi:hypothetical protein